ncbi:hypothetical protein TIFTF001_052129 [Ficus carica]|uniref:Uncharacterized protein n=1 Tax=Ficus carica TaxID=3494 RepID=A0AA88JHY8_FICCA|nr:hypothetical protein TIFTF001_052129 [Ficus carica]
MNRQPWMLLTLARYGSFEQSINLLPNKLLSAKSGALFGVDYTSLMKESPRVSVQRQWKDPSISLSISTALTCTFHLVHRPHESDLALYCPPRKLQTTPLRLSDLIDLTFLLGFFKTIQGFPFCKAYRARFSSSMSKLWWISTPFQGRIPTSKRWDSPSSPGW